ncbi:hypothetical protein DXG01_012771 [Tephrocybe rancida]|nr:hypothetical protein DXG01_012771 [Tephrocybe rancida]
MTDPTRYYAQLPPQYSPWSGHNQWPAYICTPVKPYDAWAPYTEPIPESLGVDTDEDQEDVSIQFSRPSYYCMPVPPRPPRSKRASSNHRPPPIAVVPPSPELDGYENAYEAPEQNESIYRYHPYAAPERKSQSKLSSSIKDFSRQRKAAQPYGADLHFSPMNLAPRPAYWRPDYKPPRATKLRRLSFRSRPGFEHQPTYSKFVPGGTSKYTLHPLIHYISSISHPLSHDLRSNPETTNFQHLNLPRYSNDLDLYQVATTPPVHELCLYHAKLPWTITIQATQSNGITIGDIFCQMYENLSRQITAQDFYNVVLSAADREELTASYVCRCAPREDGVLRMDFLGPDIMFLGLVKGKHGLLEIKTGPVPSL